MELASEDAEKGAARWLAPLLILVCGVVAYCDSFTGPFVYDDVASIPRNVRIRSLAPDFRPEIEPTTLSGRPVSAYSFAVQYAVAGLNLVVCHGVNLAIHLSCGLLLYGIVRRTLSNRGLWGDRFSGSERWVAGAVALIWVVHPLNTMAVTYIVQRVESLAALFYLGVIYCLIRWAGDRRVGWAVVALLACALGMGSKETMVTAPVMALLYDRTFLSGSFKEAIKRRWMFYVGLVGTWVILIVLVGMNRRIAAGTFSQGISVRDYARTQLDVVAHYLRLAVWPAGLVFDAHDWPVDWSWWDVGAGGWLILGLLVGTAVAVWRKPWLGFLGAWVFVILSPSSSIVPSSTEVTAEQRMYMSLMAIVALVVAGGWVLAGRWQIRKLACGVVVAMVVALTCATVQRNWVYHSEESLWRDVVIERPGNSTGRFGLGVALAQAGELPEAKEQFEAALRIDPDYHLVVHWLGQVMLAQGQVKEAVEFCDLQIEAHSPIETDARFLRGAIRMSQQNWAGAKEDFEAVTKVLPNVVEAHYSLAVALEHLQEWKEAEAEFSRTLELAPDYKDAAGHLFQIRMNPAGRN